MSDNDIKIVFAIVDYSKGEKLRALYDEMEIPISVMTHGHGSASSEILDYLGIGESKKVIAVSLVWAQRVDNIFRALDENMSMKKQGFGIAFSCGVKSMSGMITKLCCNDIQRELEGERIMEDNKYELILTIVTKGYFSEVMDAAKENGANGGTLIHARGLGTKEAEKFLGITIQPEKDLIMIVAERENKQAIMEAITKNVGLATEGKGICFSMPVDSVMGIMKQK